LSTVCPVLKSAGPVLFITSFSLYFSYIFKSPFLQISTPSVTYSRI
jgi:hypothetical protein